MKLVDFAIWSCTVSNVDFHIGFVCFALIDVKKQVRPKFWSTGEVTLMSRSQTLTFLA